MLTRGGQSLAGHLQNEQTRFNLLYGGWDLCLAQEVTSEFPPQEDYLRGVEAVKALCDAGGCRLALYMNFESPRDTPPLSAMRPPVLAAAERFHLPVARAGEAFARAAQSCPDIDLYGRDVLGLPGRIGFAGRPVLDLPKAQAAALQAVAQSLPAAH